MNRTIGFPLWGVVLIWLLLVGGWIAFCLADGRDACVTVRYLYEYPDGSVVPDSLR
jgi:hypothetical protein